MPLALSLASFETTQLFTKMPKLYCDMPGTPGSRAISHMSVLGLLLPEQTCRANHASAVKAEAKPNTRRSWPAIIVAAPVRRMNNDRAMVAVDHRWRTVIPALNHNRYVDRPATIVVVRKSLFIIAPGIRFLRQGKQPECSDD